METRNTIQRRLVLEAVRKIACHATAEAVYQEVAKSYSDISPATVYRNLNFLAEQGCIVKLEMLDGAARYDHNTAKHYHFLCQKCGKVFDLCLPEVTQALRAPKGTDGFVIISDEVLLKGFCPDCRKENTNKEN